ncbi:MAG: YopX family protein [Muribaculum sp.]|nr:YopX family protein [Muribaculum sp.]
MRQIKFRGKDTFKSKFFPQRWLYGTPVQDGDDMWMCVKTVDKGIVSVKVDPSTVGQFTGLTDCNGKDIYEGDIVEANEYLYKVCWYDSMASFIAEMIYNGKQFRFTDNFLHDCEVVGNIHDDPSLMINQPTEV